MSVNSQLLRKIPKVDELLRLPELSELSCPHTVLTESVRETIDRVRQQILSGEQPSLEAEQLCRQVLALVHKKTTMSLRPVINATGIVLHTNLGRARLSDAAVEAIHSVAQDYNTLEYNLEKGSRGSRYSHVEKLIAKLTGTEAAMVVNNNAAAVMLVLSTMTKGKRSSPPVASWSRLAAPSAYRKSCSRAAAPWSRSAPPTRPTCPTIRTPSPKTPALC